MKEIRFVILLDFSPYSKAQLLLAQKWGSALGASLLLVHRVAVALPLMTDQESKARITAQAKVEAKEKLRQLAAEVLREPLEVHFHVTEKHLLRELPLLIQGNSFEVIFTGLKGSNFIKKHVLGSTSRAIIDQPEHVIIGVPNQPNIEDLSTVHIAVSPSYPLNLAIFDEFLQHFSKVIAHIHFVSVVTGGEPSEQANEYIQHLAKRYSNTKPTSFKVFEGNDPLLLLKQYMQGHSRGILVLQRGSRALSDQLFRRFFIGELVDHGQIPLVVLP